MRQITSILFWLANNILSTLIPIIFFPVFLYKNSEKLANIGAKIWSKLLTKTLKFLCQIDYKVIGKENLPKEPFIVACKHQSMWETTIFNLIFDAPAYIFKKELLKIPFYGWFIAKMTSISVDREGGGKSLRDLMKQGKKMSERNKNIIIFPQGTRVPVGAKTDKYPYQPGVFALYSACKVPVVPVALNSGCYWSKSKIMHKKGFITLEFLPAIETGLSKEEFMQKLEKQIEEKSEELLLK